MKRFTILAVALVAFAFQAQSASAEPEHEIVHGTLEVAVNGGGKVTGVRINCGTDCSDSATWPDNQLPPNNLLTATPDAGWAFSSWTGCPATAGAGKCNATYSEFGGDPVTANFVDVMSPSVFISSVSPAYEIGNSVTVGVNTSDNDRVTRVEYLIDGNVTATARVAPWTAALDTTGVAEGTHQLQARSYDPSGNSGITAAREVTIDHTGPRIDLSSPVLATNAATARFSFDSAAQDFQTAYCAIQRSGGEVGPVWCGRNEWFSADTPTEGEWQFVVHAFDRAGNETLVTHDFVVDRTAPEAAFTVGPADGAVVQVGNVSYEWAVTDGLPVTQACSWDGGEESACDGSAARGLTAGAHAFKVVIADRAGNATTLSRTVNVKKDGDTPGPGPDTSDRSAPAVKIFAPRQKLKALGKALRLNVRCSEAVSGRVTVTATGGVKFSGRVLLDRAGVAKLKLKPAAKVRKRLAKLSRRGLRMRPLKLAAAARLIDQAGNVGKANLRFRVKR